MKKAWIATLALAAVAASAQQGPPPRGAGPRGPMSNAGAAANRAIPSTTETARLLSLASVQSDLALTVAERSQLASIVRMLGAPGTTEDTALAAVSKALTAAQVTRLKELLVQDMGYGALAVSDVRSALGLSAEQESQIGTIETSLAASKQALRDGRSAPTAESRLTAQANAQLAKVLTSEQDAKLRSLVGRTLGAR